MWVDIIGQLLGSNFPTIASVTLLIIVGALMYFKGLPMIDELKELRQQKEEGTFQADKAATDLEEIKGAIQSLAENAPVDNLDMKESLDSLYKAMQRFERTLVQMSKDSQAAQEVGQEAIRLLGEVSNEMSAVKQRLQSLSSAVYSTTGTRDSEGFSDLRELR